MVVADLYIVGEVRVIAVSLWGKESPLVTG